MSGGCRQCAAIIVEPVTGTNGILIPPDGYMQGLRELCDRHGIMLIADEVMAGFGRTGEWFSVALEGHSRSDNDGQGSDKAPTYNLAQ